MKESFEFLLLFILAIATWQDLTRHLIPNVLTFSAAILGMCVQIWLSGLQGMLTGLEGLAVGLAMLLPFYIRGGMGAGDVKMMAAVGTFLGPMNTVMAVAMTLMAGGVMGIGVILLRGNIRGLLYRYGLMAQCLFVTGSVSYVPPQADETTPLRGVRFPYAVAIATGTLAVRWLA